MLRPANQADRTGLAHLIHFGPYVHQHINWRSPLDWLGRDPYLVMEQDKRIVATLACPLEKTGVTWIQLFAVSAELSVESAWTEMWPAIIDYLKPGTFIAALPLQDWFELILKKHAFSRRYQIAILDWLDRGQRIKAGAFDLRPMQADDIRSVCALDTKAFDPIWRQSAEILTIALRNSVSATVVERHAGIIGYQISTINAGEGHIARLAVTPEAQNKGVGQTLVSASLARFRSRSIDRVTVNTQVNNYPSLALYRKMGFQNLEETYSVYRYGEDKES